MSKYSMLSSTCVCAGFFIIFYAYPALGVAIGLLAVSKYLDENYE